MKATLFLSCVLLGLLSIGGQLASAGSVASDVEAQLQAPVKDVPLPSYAEVSEELKRALSDMGASHVESDLIKNIVALEDWKLVYEESIAMFQKLLQIDTTNKDGQVPREDLAVAFLREIFDKEDIDYKIVHKEGADTRQNIIARIKGNGSGKKALLLSAHLDVVPANGADWTTPPFSGQIKKDEFGVECLWGRGAVDMKNMVAMSVTTMVLLKRRGVQLDRDVIFAGVADEENGMAYGSKFLVDEHRDLIGDAEYLFSEVGGVTYYISGKRFYMVQIAEKGACKMQLLVKGQPSHGSMLSSDNALVKASRVIDLLAKTEFEPKISPATTAMINKIADNLGAKGMVFKQLLSKRMSNTVLKALPAESRAPFYAILHNTHNPTMMQSGESVNQVPPLATVTFDVRFPPASNREEAMEELKSVVDKVLKPEEYEIKMDEGAWNMPAAEGDPNDPMLKVLESVVVANDPGAVVAPAVVPGGTDAKYYAQIEGLKCFGFSPTKFPEEIPFKSLYHANNERIPIEGFTWGVKVLYETVLSVCASVKQNGDRVMEPVEAAKADDGADGAAAVAGNRLRKADASTVDDEDILHMDAVGVNPVKRADANTISDGDISFSMGDNVSHEETRKGSGIPDDVYEIPDDVLPKGKGVE